MNVCSSSVLYFTPLSGNFNPSPLIVCFIRGGIAMINVQAAWCIWNADNSKTTRDSQPVVSSLSAWKTIAVEKGNLSFFPCKSRELIISIIILLLLLFFY